MGFLKNAFDFVRSPTHSRTTAVIVLFLIFAAIPLTVLISQQQQQIKQRAAGNFCAEVAQLCSADVTIGSDCTNENLRCKLGNEIIECK